MRIFSILLLICLTLQFAREQPKAFAHESRAGYSIKVQQQIRANIGEVRESGRVLVVFRINKSGRLLWYQIKKSSGVTKLDQEVLNIIKRSAPFPKVPDNFTAPLVFTLPLSFKSGQPKIVTYYRKRVLRRILSYRKFTRIKTAKGKLAAQVRFIVARSGRILSVKLLRSSQNRAFDREAVKMIKSVSPLPPFPNKRKKPLTLTVPVRYVVK